MNEFIITIEDLKINVNLISENEAIIGKKKVQYELIYLNCRKNLLRIDNNFYEISSEKIGDGKYSLLVGGKNIITIARTELQERATKLIEEAKISSEVNVEIKAPMPGMILKIKKQSGDKIEAGESVLILEAMKMENDLRAPVSGTIKDLLVSEGKAVEKDDILFSLE